MKVLLIVLLATGVWAEPVIDKDCSELLAIIHTQASYEWIGNSPCTKIYEPSPNDLQGGKMMYHAQRCWKYICEENWVEGEDCFEHATGWPPVEHRYDQLKKRFGR